MFYDKRKMEVKLCNIANIVQDFGGLTRMSEATNIPISTIQSWTKSGVIPYWRKDAVAKAAEEKGIKLPEDFYSRQ